MKRTRTHASFDLIVTCVILPDEEIHLVYLTSLTRLYNSVIKTRHLSSYSPVLHASTSTSTSISSIDIHQLDCPSRSFFHHAGHRLPPIDWKEEALAKLRNEKNEKSSSTELRSLTVPIPTYIHRHARPSYTVPSHHSKLPRKKERKKAKVIRVSEQKSPYIERMVFRSC